MDLQMERILQDFDQLVHTPSVVGYTPQIHAVLRQKAEQIGYPVEIDHKHTTWVKVPGKDHSKTRAVLAHVDTIGLLVTGIEDNGWLCVRNLGGINFHSLESCNVFIHTRERKTYTGSVICKHHSVHVFDNAREMERVAPNMRVVLDELVQSKEDVLALGILPGDLISVEPGTQFTPSGFVKSRHVDDKIHSAILFECLRLLKENNLQPAYDTWFGFPMYEEIGLGGAYMPAPIEEVLALDIGSIGPGYNGSEQAVSICTADRIAPYDWNLTTRLIELAKQEQLNYAVDVFYRYASDATEAFNSGQNVRIGLIGCGTLNSHGYERTHQQAIKNTTQLTMAYLLDEGK